MLQFAKGLGEGSKFVVPGTPLGLCVDSQQKIIDGGNMTFQLIQANFTIYGTLLAIDKGLGVVYTAGGIGENCVTGVMSIQSVIG